MMSLLQILVEDIAVPEILNLLHRNVPTDSQMVIILKRDVQATQAQGQGFLDQMLGRPPGPPPAPLPLVPPSLSTE